MICRGEAKPGESRLPAASSATIAMQATTSGRPSKALACASISIPGLARNNDAARERREDNRALNEALPRERRLREENHVVDETKGEGAEDAAKHAADAAGKRGAAEHHGGDRRQCQPGADQR